MGKVIVALSLFFWAYIFSLVVFNQNPGTGKEFPNMMFFFSVLQVQSYCK